MTEENFDDTIKKFFTDLSQKQEPLGEDFEQVLNDNWWDLCVRSCIHCGRGVEGGSPYALCQMCQDNESCGHGTPYKEVCSKCLTEEDRMYDEYHNK